MVFSCGAEQYDLYLQQQAGQDEKKCLASCWVLTMKDSVDVVGYYTLSSTSILLPDLPETVSKKLPKYPKVPATLIGRLASSSKDEHKGMRIGEYLLLDALHRAWLGSKTIASFAIVVDSETDSIGFYKHYNFLELDRPERLFIEMAQIAKLFS